MLCISYTILYRSLYIDVTSPLPFGQIRFWCAPNAKSHLLGIFNLLSKQVRIHTYICFFSVPIVYTDFKRSADRACDHDHDRGAFRLFLHVRDTDTHRTTIIYNPIRWQYDVDKSLSLNTTPRLPLME